MELLSVIQFLVPGNFDVACERFRQAEYSVFSPDAHCLSFSYTNQHIAASLCVARSALVHAVNQYISIIPGGSLANFL